LDAARYHCGEVMDIRTVFLSHRESLAAAGLSSPWVLVFDIDSTIMDTGPRNWAIIDEAIRELPELKGVQGAGAADSLPEVWDVCGAFALSAGLDADAESALRRFWKERFFTDAWLRHDRPYPGVRDCLWALKNDGFFLVYLTGRDAPNMLAGSRENFLECGLPAGDDERFVFKPHFDIPDKVFKHDACDRIASFGTIVGTVDNITDNSNLFERNFPAARHVCLATISPDNTEPLSPTVIRAGLSSWMGR